MFEWCVDFLGVFGFRGWMLFVENGGVFLGVSGLCVRGFCEWGF